MICSLVRKNKNTSLKRDSDQPSPHEIVGRASRLVPLGALGVGPVDILPHEDRVESLVLGAADNAHLLGGFDLAFDLTADDHDHERRDVGQPDHALVGQLPHAGVELEFAAAGNMIEFALAGGELDGMCSGQLMLELDELGKPPSQWGKTCKTHGISYLSGGWV